MYTDEHPHPTITVRREEGFPTKVYAGGHMVGTYKTERGVADAVTKAWDAMQYRVTTFGTLRDGEIFTVDGTAWHTFGRAVMDVAADATVVLRHDFAVARQEA